jgi:hypothetical protein
MPRKEQIIAQAQLTIDSNTTGGHIILELIKARYAKPNLNSQGLQELEP